MLFILLTAQCSYGARAQSYQRYLPKGPTRAEQSKDCLFPIRFSIVAFNTPEVFERIPHSLKTWFLKSRNPFLLCFFPVPPRGRNLSLCISRHGMVGASCGNDCSSSLSAAASALSIAARRIVWSAAKWSGRLWRGLELVGVFGGVELMGVF